MRFQRRIRSVLWVSCALFAAHPALAAPQLAAHRAVYDLSLVNATDKSGITGMTGRMVYEFTGSACAGYTVRYRFVTKTQTDQDSRLTDQQTTTHEDAEGRTFSFATKTYLNQTLTKEVDGTATHANGKTLVRLAKPKQASLSLPMAEFPTQQIVNMLGRAEKGQTFYTADLFDGSDDANKVMATTVVIGKQKTVGTDDPEKSALAAIKVNAPSDLDRYWPVTVAYFDTSAPADKKGEEAPTYRISFKLLDNGITRDLFMDYGDFSMKGKLVKLTLLKPQPDSCKP